MTLVRFFVSILLGVVVTVGLFLLMQRLIEPDNILPEDTADAPPIEIIRAQRDEEVNQRDRELQRPQEQEDPPPPPPPAATTSRPDVSGQRIGLPNARVDLGNLGDAVVLDRDPQPIVRIPPQYPRRAAQRGQEGFVVVEFTIATDGSVKDPRVVESSSSVFESAAIAAVRRWKYNPQIVNGEPVERPGLRVTIDFQLEGDGR